MLEVEISTKLSVESERRRPPGRQGAELVEEAQRWPCDEVDRDL